MKRQNQNGSVMVTTILSVLLVLSLIFGLWAFSGRQDYKNKSDAKVATAVATATKQQADKDQAAYAEQSQQPYTTFTGPSTTGTISFQYPKTWNAYVDQTSDNEPINAYYFKGAVPGVDSDTSYPLRVELVSQDYTQVIQNYSNDISQGNIKAVAYVPPKLAKTANVQAGLKLDGQIGTSHSGVPIQGSMVIIKVRDKTLQVYTQTQDGLSDFNSVVLPSLTFVP